MTTKEKNRIISKNIKKLVDDWKISKSIGTSHPKTKKEAVKMAVAIAIAKGVKQKKSKKNNP
jgi:hypothetical protein